MTLDWWDQIVHPPRDLALAWRQRGLAPAPLRYTSHRDIAPTLNRLARPAGRQGPTQQGLFFIKNDDFFNNVNQVNPSSDYDALHNFPSR
ncbi:MAG: hypothetical protein KJ614_03045 [Gammaproteobacteria bacterium]|uniref:hypothetical protein n=1 Tax=Rhodoferax sp. TaxID=50421 RepID=UPI00185168B3|nr:hypothetical protein [Rhodoferax sp.]MBU3897893.1 hypothetical protein [Gammaproteobacteria bacterium]MBA3057760.1 hypothetical protein [Rhodoferax sp.]MBU3998871.1 hypothetical protein [Gammaproteobacteria bacterium]MBU4019464.1 hypothetical protein [Gammaproteobacteria bacterium]MBU4080786.1 hypothetical protein [Gammaproteobacteria bacterium]